MRSSRARLSPVGWDEHALLDCNLGMSGEITSTLARLVCLRRRPFRARGAECFCPLFVMLGSSGAPRSADTHCNVVRGQPCAGKEGLPTWP